jgi:GNAT superfamily N-acetyltransferase
MEIALSRCRSRLPEPVAPGYRLVGWRADLVDVHAETKYLSFRSEIDADVFPCLGERVGCRKLMDEIQRKEGFLPEATWLVEYLGCDGLPRGYCGTVQGIRVDGGYGGIQNLGVVPEHRGRGMGRLLMEQALVGFRQAGLRRAYLEVTAQNTAAIRLYQSLGFCKTRTLYKAVEVALR